MTCVKKKLTIEKAKAILEMAYLSPDPKRKEKKYYYCSECKAYHTTSKAGKNWDKVEVKDVFPEHVVIHKPKQQNEIKARIFLEAEDYKAKNRKKLKRKK